MIRDYSNSLNDSLIKTRNRDSNTYVIDKEDILEMFSKKEKNKNKFNIFR